MDRLEIIKAIHSNSEQSKTGKSIYYVRSGAYCEIRNEFINRDVYEDKAFCYSKDEVFGFTKDVSLLEYLLYADDTTFEEVCDKYFSLYFKAFFKPLVIMSKKEYTNEVLEIVKSVSDNFDELYTYMLLNEDRLEEYYTYDYIKDMIPKSVKDDFIHMKALRLASKNHVIGRCQDRHLLVI